MCYKMHIAKCESDLYTHSAPRRLRTYNCHDIIKGKTRRIKEPRSRLDLLLVKKIIRAKVQNIFTEVNNLVFRKYWNLEHFPHVIPMRRCDHSKEFTVKFISVSASKAFTIIAKDCPSSPISRCCFRLITSYIL